jgi:UDP:flavonoid glycosyltransferase YjiC (YdhE family)
MAAHILIATIGSLGDLNPFIAIGQALARRGACVRLAVPAEQVERVRAAGLNAQAVLPADAGLSPDAVARGMPRAQLATTQQILVRTLPEYVRRLDAMAAGADAIVASPFVLAAPIVAEKRRIPLIPALLQPFALPLPGDAPHSPGLWMLASGPADESWRGRWQHEWNDAMMAGTRRFLTAWLGPAINKVRQNHGLPARWQSPLFTLPARPALALYPQWFADTTQGLDAIGFARGQAGSLDAELTEWLQAGPPPLVFTLGSLVGASPGGFPAAALATARALGRRAVLLAPGPPHRDVDMITRSHIDYGALLPHAAAVVHHGGIGTLADALAAGKPQLIVPHLGDQFDNGARAERLGFGRTMASRDFNGGAGVAAIDAVLADAGIAHAVARRGPEVRSQSGSANAAHAILAQIDNVSRRPAPVANLPWPSRAAVWSQRRAAG